MRGMLVLDPPSAPVSPGRPLRPERKRRPLVMLCAAASIIVHASASCDKNVPKLAFHSVRPAGENYGNRWQPEGSMVPEQVFRMAKRSSTPVMPLTNSSSKLSDISSNIEQLESLHRERRSSTSLPPGPQNKKEQFRPEAGLQSKSAGKKRRRSAHGPRVTLKSILRKPVGELAPSDLKGLCNSIRHNPRGRAFCNLAILERILMELDHWGYRGNAKGRGRAAFLKPTHVFSMLTALSADVTSRKRSRPRADGNRADRRGPHRERIGARDIQRLVRVVALLRQQRSGIVLDPGCYTEDVPSFACMISAEASRWEASAVDAALLFLDMVGEDGGGGDPRLVGAVLDALARSGRAEDAQVLLARATGVEISGFDPGPNDGGVAAAHFRHMNPSRAGLCYDALLRAWSKKALLLAGAGLDHGTSTQKEMKKSTQLSNKMLSAESSMDQARHIILNHIPHQSGLAITNRTCAGVLQGYSALGMGPEAERMLVELEVLHLSPLYSTPSMEFPSSSSMSLSALDVVCYNTVVHACSQSKDSDDTVIAERLFMAMKERTPLKISVTNSTISYVHNKEETLTFPSFSVLPPQPDLISYSSMLNCYCKHGMVPKAEQLLDEMHSSFTPNIACYLPVMLALEKSDEADAPDQILSWMERSKGSLLRPNRLIYTAALRCMRRHGRGVEAETVLEKFQDAFPNGGGPDVHSYISVLRAWEKVRPKSDRPNAAERAEIFFNKMEARANASLLPALEVNAYNILLNCYARAGDAEKAEQLLADLEDGMLKPNSKSYSMVIKSLANSNAEDAVDRAWQILYCLGFPQETKSTSPLDEPVDFNVSIDNFNAMIMLFAKRGMASEAEALLNSMDELIVEGRMNNGGPDIRSYEAVLEALGRCGDADAPKRAEALVTRLEVKNEMGGNFQPSLLAYNTLLNCYANAGMAGKAERLLERLNGPDSYSFGSTIKAIANSGKNKIVAMSRAESLARKLGNGNNEISFAHRLRLCSKFGLGFEAEQLLSQMEEQNLKPGLIHCTAALNAWAKSTDNDANARAEKLFRRMEYEFDLDLAVYHGLLLNYSVRGNYEKAMQTLQKILDSPNIKPNRKSFTMAIDSYHRSKYIKAGDKAEELLDSMRQLHAAGNSEVEPDSITYASVIRCKQLSANIEKIQDLSEFEKMKMMRHLQMETWPFRYNK